MGFGESEAVKHTHQYRGSTVAGINIGKHGFNDVAFTEGECFDAEDRLTDVFTVFCGLIGNTVRQLSIACGNNDGVFTFNSKVQSEARLRCIVPSGGECIAVESCGRSDLVAVAVLCNNKERAFCCLLDYSVRQGCFNAVIAFHSIG